MMTNKRVIKVLILLSFMYLSLIGYLTYIEIFQNQTLDEHPNNQRQYDIEDVTKRGTITDINGVIIAESDTSVRMYPYRGMYSHIIGYSSSRFSKINIEKTFDEYLLAKNKIFGVLGSSGNEYGHDLKLTIDHSIQELAYNLFGNNKGCVIAIAPKTGAVIAMVSKPDFDPNENTLIENWEQLKNSEDNPFVARATSGLYPPGSTFKMLTALGAVENGLDETEYEDEGKITIGGQTFNNQKNKKYGKISLNKGFAVSSNVVFGSLGDELGGGTLRNIAERFGFNKNLGFDIDCKQSVFPTENIDDAHEAALGIGQGDMLATPLQMAMVTCGIANNGMIMKPYLVDSVITHDGYVVKQFKPAVLYNSANKADTKKVVDMMVETVESEYGTGKGAYIKGIQVAGKTGTAENSSDKNHTWFVSFAPAYNPEIAVVVMMEESGGSGSGNCVPIAKQIIEKYLKK